MAVNSEAARALAETMTLEELDTARRAALSDYLSGVTITSVNMGASSSSGEITGKPEDILAAINAAIDYKNGVTSSFAPPPMASAIDLSTRRIQP